MEKRKQEKLNMKRNAARAVNLFLSSQNRVYVNENSNRGVNQLYCVKISSGKGCPVMVTDSLRNLLKWINLHRQRV